MLDRTDFAIFIVQLDIDTLVTILAVSSHAELQKNDNITELFHQELSIVM